MSQVRLPTDMSQVRLHTDMSQVLMSVGKRT
jgi:hypothetical protein